MEINTYTAKGQNGSYALPASLADVAVDHPLVKQFVLMALANRRTVTAHTKTRADVRVSGRKLYRQKGTGHARVGDAGSPIRKGGGVAFGPRNTRNYSQKMPKKMRTHALASSFVAKAHADKVVALDVDFADAPSTKQAAQLIAQLPTASSYLIVSSTAHDAFNASVRNLEHAVSKDYRYVSAYDMVRYDCIVLVSSVADDFVARFA